MLDKQWLSEQTLVLEGQSTWSDRQRWREQPLVLDWHSERSGPLWLDELSVQSDRQWSSDQQLELNGRSTRSDRQWWSERPLK